MNQYIVSINIIGNEGLLNTGNIPFLFYSNNKDIKEELKNDEGFISFLNEKCLSINNYGNISLSYISLNLSTEEYNTDSFLLQEWYKLEENDNKLKYEYIKYYFNYLYKCSYKTDFSFSENLLDKDIRIIYNDLKKQNQGKISKNIIINFIRSELMNENNNINLENTEHIISVITKILEGEE